MKKRVERKRQNETKWEIDSVYMQFYTYTGGTDQFFHPYMVGTKLDKSIKNVSMFMISWNQRNGKQPYKCPNKTD